MITRELYLMGRDKEYPLQPEFETNIDKLLSSVNRFISSYGHEVNITSGYRPGHYNQAAGGAPHSAHVTCEAVDLDDRDRLIGRYAKANLWLLEECGLYLEEPAFTKRHCHLQTRAPKSGKRVFIP